MRLVITIILSLMFLCSIALAQLLEENFDYTTGDLTTTSSGNWANHSGSGSFIQVTSPGLTYSGYPSSGIGNAATLMGGSGSREDVNRQFSQQTSDVVYASFIVNVTSAPTGGDYFLHLGPTTLGTTFRGRVLVRDDGGGNLNFGVSKGSSTGTFSPTSFSYGTTYLIVLKYEFLTGSTTDDEVSLFVFTSPTLPGTEPGTPEIGPITDTTTDPSDLGSVALRQGSGTYDIIIDGIRIGTDWSDAPLPVSLTSFTASAGNNRVTLRWATASEQENIGFKILRSNEKQGNYELMSTYENNPDLEGQFNSTSETKYRFVDETVINGVTYWYKLVDVDVNGVHTEHGPMSATPHEVGNDITTVSAVPAGSFELHPNFPNPFNPSTTLRFDIPALSRQNQTVEVAIFNARGQRIKTLFKGTLAPGTHELTWNGDSDNGTLVSSGMYYAKLRMENLVRTSKMLLLK